VSIKVGVIGVGYLGRHHARVYSELEDVELVAVVDTDIEKAKEIAGKYGSRTYSDYRQVLSDVQALSIVTPTKSHYSIAMDCLNAGCDVLIEKPMTETVAEADALINEAEKKGAVLQVGHLERYNPAVIAASKLVDKPEFLEAERISPFIERAANIDVTLDLMIHDIDIVTSFLDGSNIKNIKAVGAKVLTEKVDVAKAWLEFENGVTALVTANRLSGEKQRVLRIFQKDSYIVIDYQNKNVKRYFKTSDGIASESVPVEDKEPLKEELADFINCVKNRQRPKVSGIEGRNALKVVMDITEMIGSMNK
jgi:predicted dehydrogenase